MASRAQLNRMLRIERWLQGGRQTCHDAGPKRAVFVVEKDKCFFEQRHKLSIDLCEDQRRPVLECGMRKQFGVAVLAGERGGAASNRPCRLGYPLPGVRACPSSMRIPIRAPRSTGFGGFAAGKARFKRGNGLVERELLERLRAGHPVRLLRFRRGRGPRSRKVVRHLGPPRLATPVTLRSERHTHASMCSDPCLFW